MKKMIMTAAMTASIMCCSGILFTAQASVSAETEVQTSGSFGSYRIGDTVEDFTVTFSDGTQMALSEMLQDHKAVYLNFWATYCQPCEEEFPAMNQAALEYQEDIFVAAVSSYYGDNAEAVTSYKETHGLDISMAAGNPELAGEYGIEAIPTSFLINQDGVLCWADSGTIPDVSIFRRIFQDVADSKDPSELVGYEVPAFVPGDYGVEKASSEELAAGLGVDEAVVTVKNSDEENVWPFLVDKENGGLYASNSGYCKTKAAVIFEVHAAAGDAVRFLIDENNSISGEDGSILMNGEPYKMIVSGSGEREILCVFEDEGEDGVQKIEVDYEILQYITPTKDGWFKIKGIDVLTGEEAAQAAGSMGEYPVAEDCDGVSLSLAELKQPITFQAGDQDITDMLAETYLINGDLHLYGQIGPDVDPDCVMVYDNISERGKPLTSYPTDEDGFIIDIVPAEFSDQYQVGLYLYLYDPVTAVASGGMLVLPEAETVDQYCAELSLLNGVDVTWKDENAGAVDPSSETEPELAAGTEAVMAGTEAEQASKTEQASETEQASKTEQAEAGQTSENDYIFTVLDQNGDPVAGAMLQVCDDDTCTVFSSDEEGKVRFDRENGEFEIHILMVPEGYTADNEAVIPAPEKGVDTQIEVTKN